jgi:hypothetical protein
VDTAGSTVNGEDRLATLLSRSPGVKAWEDDDGWRGTVPVDEEQWIAAGPCDTPDYLAGALEARAADAAEVRAIEAEHAGWLARRWADGTWQAVRPLGPDTVPTRVTASDPGTLRKAIRAAAVAAP